MTEGISAKTTGIADIDRRLALLAGSAARKVVRASVGPGLTELAGELRAQTRSADVSKRMRAALLKTIGKRFKNKKEGPQLTISGRRGNEGPLEAKAGFGVGKRQPAQTRTPGSGVGISKRNVHWAILGTNDRTQETTGKHTGAMPEAPKIARVAAEAALSSVHSTIDQVAREKLEQVVAALRSK